VPDKTMVFRMQSIFTNKEFDEILNEASFLKVENSEFIYKRENPKDKTAWRTLMRDVTQMKQTTLGISTIGLIQLTD